MAAWNFRQILDVYPDGPAFTCVGTTKKNARCRQSFFSTADKSQAANLLNEMDRCKSLKDSYKYLDNLASLTLCPRWHRKPGYDQVDEVSSRWRHVIAQYEVAMAKATMQRAELALAGLKRTERVWREELKEQRSQKLSTTSIQTSNVLKERQPNFQLSKTTSTSSSKLQDPFNRDPKVPSNTDPLRPATIFSSGASETKLIPPRKAKVAVLPDQPKQEPAYENRLSRVPFHPFALPTPPETPESYQQVKEQNEEADYLLSTPTKVSKDKPINEGSFTIKRTSTVTTTEIKASFDIVSGLNPKSDLSSQNYIASNPIEFEAPDNLSSAMRLPERSSNEAGAGQPKAMTPEKPNKTAPTAIHDVTNILRNPPQVIEECFGYAIITPESKRYKTYLPAQQQYGMMTPPDTPDASPNLEIKTDSFEASFPQFAVRPALSRKPLPRLTVPLCAECGNGQGGSCSCGEKYEDEEVKAGCLDGLGLRRLGKKVVGKVKALKRRVSKSSVDRNKP